MCFVPQFTFFFVLSAFPQRLFHSFIPISSVFFSILSILEYRRLAGASIIYCHQTGHGMSMGMGMGTGMGIGVCVCVLLTMGFSSGNYFFFRPQLVPLPTAKENEKESKIDVVFAISCFEERSSEVKFWVVLLLDLLL